jgi:methylated-DNA-[protein]-cysteine S-methyltransferase
MKTKHGLVKSTVIMDDDDEEKFTPFQRRVYDVVGKIARGTVRTYGSIAKELDTSARAVGQAMGRSPGPSETVP